jgi:O-antigen/teichoic acid export membrane protein
MRLSTKIAYNSIAQISGKAVTTVLGLAAVMIMARYLGAQGFGAYTTIMTFLSFFGILADFGMTLVAVQMISKPGVNEKKILDNLFTLRFISAALFLSLASVFAIFFPYDSEIKTGIALTAISFFFVALNQILVAVFQKNLRLDKASIAEVVGRAALLVGVIMAAFFDFGLLAMMLAVVAGSAVNFILHFYFSRKFVKINPAFDLQIWKEAVKLSWPLALTTIFNLLYLKTDTLILSALKSQTEVGLYGAAYKVIEVVTTIPFMLAGIILPVLSAAWFGGQKEYFKRILQKIFDLAIILSVPFIAGAQILSTAVISAAAGTEFLPAGNILRLLSIAAGLVFLSCILSHSVVAAGKQKEIIAAYFFTAITSLIGYFIFIPRYSCFGAAGVTIYSEAAITIFMIYYARKFMGFSPSWRVFWQSSAAAAVMSAFLLVFPEEIFLNWVYLLLLLTAAGAVYFLSLYIFGGLTKKDLNDLLNRSA